jgi:hypothetical protein
MKRMDLIAFVLSVTLISCNGQSDKQNGGSDTSSAAPRTNIKVDKQYDSNGNLIKYDSTYSYYYSNVSNNKNMRDSIFSDFRNHFNQKYFFSDDPFFNDLFFQDSLLKYDFYRKDFFMNRFRNNMGLMDTLFWRMDSLKNSFFNKQFVTPGPVKSPKTK